MKKLLLVAFSIAITSSLSRSQSPIIQTVIDETNVDSLIFFVEELSGEVQTIIGGSPYTIVSRHKNQPSNDKAADYIKQKLESYGLQAYDQWFSGSGRNVYAVQTGTDFPNQKYIICAHYDDMPSGPTAPGADDNASGTAAVLEAARILSQYLAKYTIIYALWDEEEQGLVGAYYYAQQASSAGDSILGVINMDMIAWDSNSDYIADVHTRPIGSSIYLKDKIIETNNLYSLGLNIDVKNPGSTYSDHAAFWNYNFGAILLIEDGTDFNNYYHTTNDKVQYFNQLYYLMMSKVSIGTFAALAEVTNNVPVELVSFKAFLLKDGIKLEWSTASELNNNGFEIERSLNTWADFVPIGFVEGNGTTTEITNYSYTDPMDFTGVQSIQYRLKQIDLDGSFSYSNIVNVDVNIPNEFVLNQNYPNPFNPTTKISYSIASDAFVSLKVFDFLGKKVTALVNETKLAGTHEIAFDASNLPSGTYFYTLRAGDFISTKKMILIK
ncbi:MAG: M20/M25/M40 family metallo-hydrolase [Ignavibacterium sp.]|nr:MAG: M20/M25/M40 family metallo-hydrolase [Ignavibacterium sp.]